jgi:hypothetical protein
VDHGEEPVAEALELPSREVDATCSLSLAEHLQHRQGLPRSVAVPDALSGYRVESADAKGHDRLLGGGGT